MNYIKEKSASTTTLKRTTATFIETASSSSSSTTTTTTTTSHQKRHSFISNKQQQQQQQQEQQKWERHNNNNNATMVTAGATKDNRTSLNSLLSVLGNIKNSNSKRSCSSGNNDGNNKTRPWQRLEPPRTTKLHLFQSQQATNKTTNSNSNITATKDSSLTL